jgi:hypothetical protein
MTTANAQAQVRWAYTMGWASPEHTDRARCADGWPRALVTPNCLMAPQSLNSSALAIQPSAPARTTSWRPQEPFERLSRVGVG